MCHLPMLDKPRPLWHIQFCSLPCTPAVATLCPAYRAETPPQPSTHSLHAQGLAPPVIGMYCCAGAMAQPGPQQDSQAVPASSSAFWAVVSTSLS